MVLLNNPQFLVDSCGQIPVTYLLHELAILVYERRQQVKIGIGEVLADFLTESQTDQLGVGGLYAWPEEISKERQIIESSHKKYNEQRVGAAAIYWAFLQ